MWSNDIDESGAKRWSLDLFFWFLPFSNSYILSIEHPSSKQYLTSISLEIQWQNAVLRICDASQQIWTAVNALPWNEEKYIMLNWKNTLLVQWFPLFTPIFLIFPVFFAYALSIN